MRLFGCGRRGELIGIAASTARELLEMKLEEAEVWIRENLEGGQRGSGSCEDAFEVDEGGVRDVEAVEELEMSCSPPPFDAPTSPTRNPSAPAETPSTHKLHYARPSTPPRPRLHHFHPLHPRSTLRSRLDATLAACPKPSAKSRSSTSSRRFLAPPSGISPFERGRMAGITVSAGLTLPKRQGGSRRSSVASRVSARGTFASRS